MMSRLSSFVSFVGLFFLMTTQRSFGLPRGRTGQDEDLNNQERGHIREVIKIALKEFKDQDILKVLKESLELRLKVCFSPFESLPRTAVETSDSYGLVEDEEFTTEQKKGLRELLLECLEHFDEREMLDFLTHSIEFRVKYCPWPYNFLNLSPSPGSVPVPSDTPRSPTQLPVPTSGAAPTTSSPITNARAPSTAEAITQSTSEESPTGNTAFEAHIGDQAMPDVAQEGSLSEISSQSDDPSQILRGIQNDATEEVAKRVSNLLASPRRSRFGMVKKDAPKEQAEKLKKLHPLNQFKLGMTGMDSDKKLAGTFVSEAQTDEEKPKKASEPSVGGAIEDIGKLAKRVPKKSGSPTGSKVSLSNLVPDKKSGLQETDALSETEPRKTVHQSIVSSSEDVRKATLQEKDRASQIMAANSDNGEFSSVMRIDYSELAHRADHPSVVGIDLGLIAESNDELS